MRAAVEVATSKTASAVNRTCVAWRVRAPFHDHCMASPLARDRRCPTPLPIPIGGGNLMLNRLTHCPLFAAALLALALPAAALAESPSDRNGPLIEKVRAATSRYRNINVALGEGWVQATPCVSGPNEGAMGVHFLKPERLHDGVLKADEPEMLIYEPLHGGAFRLVGVEFVVLASEWASHNPGVPATVDGHLANLVTEPNRYGLPAFYEMHVWAWEDNPNGSFADWNTRVTCARQSTPN
jgi:hypothetical protein